MNKGNNNTKEKEIELSPVNPSEISISEVIEEVDKKPANNGRNAFRGNSSIESEISMDEITKEVGKKAANSPRNALRENSSIESEISMGEIIKEAGGNSAKNASKEAANKPTLRERINDLAKKNDSKIPILGPIWNGLRRIGWGVKLLTARFSDTSRRDALKRKYHSDESKVKETEEKAKERKEIKEIVSKLEKQSNLKKAHKSNEYNELKKDNKGKFRSSLLIFAVCSLLAFGGFVTGGLIPVLLGAGFCIAGAATAINGIKNNNKYKRDKSALEERYGVKNEEDLHSLAKAQQKLIELEANLEYNETIRGNKDNKELKEKIENLKYNVKQLNKRCERSFEAVDTNLIDKGYKEIKEKIMNFNNIEGKEGKEMVGQDGKSKTAPEAPRQSHVERITEERNSSINSQVRAER